MKPLLFVGGPLDGKRFLTHSQIVDVHGHDGEYTKQKFALVREFKDLETNERTAVEIWKGRVMVWNFTTERPNLDYLFNHLSVHDYDIERLEGDALRLYGQDIA